MSRETPRRAQAAPGVSVQADRRYRRSDVRIDRRKRFVRAATRALRWALPLGLVAGVLSWGVLWLRDSSLLAVRRIEVQGHHRLSTGEVEALVDGIRGQNIFQIDFEEYRRRVNDSPWVASVTLWRVLPSTIEVRVVERTPLAIARLGRQLYLVDETGIIIDEYGPQYGDLDLPVVDGLVTASGRDANTVGGDAVRLTAALLADLSSRPDLKRRLSQVDVTNPRDAVVMFDAEPVWLHLGEERFLARVKTYLELAPTLGDEFEGVDYVDLRFDERVFVRAAGRTDGTLARADRAGTP